ncbi:MAG: FG-GAP repeat protein, partial [Thermoplasmata archaeon]
LMGEYGGDQFGYSISNAGDVDNDGKDDVIIGAPFNDENGTSAGKAYIFYFSDVYNYVSSNVTTKGFITDFEDAQSAMDSGAYAILREEGIKNELEIFNETFPQTASPWTGSNQDESWNVITLSEPNDISIASGVAAGSAVSGDPVLRMEDCDDAWGTGDIVWASVDLSGYEDVVIEYYWQLDAVDTGEGFRSAYSTDATGGLDSQGTWNQMYEHLDTPEDVWTMDTYSIPNTACVANFKFRFNARATANGEETFIDDVRITGNKTYYEMDIEFNMTDVPLVDENYLQLNYSTDGSETDFGVLVFNGTSGDWDDLSSQGDLTSTSFTEKEYTLGEDHVLGNGYVRARFIGRNESVDLVNSTLDIEYFRVKSAAGRYELLGESASDNFGCSVNNASDINQDSSYDDVIVGAPGYSTSKGRAYIFHGGSPFNNTADVILTGENNQDRFGFSVSCAGDLDGDGISDVIVGAPYWDNGATTDCGTILVFKGGSSMDTTSDFVHNGTQAGEHYGWSVSLALNVEGGSTNAVVVGAPHYDDGSNTDAGEVEILNAFVIPEFSSIAIPVVSIIMFVVIQRKRVILTSRKKHAKNIQNFGHKDGE